MTSSVRVLLPDKPVESLDAYLAGGGGEALKKALAMPGQEIIAEVKVVGKRGPRLMSDEVFCVQRSRRRARHI